MARDDSSPSADLAAVVHETTNALTVILGWLERAREAHDRPDDLELALGRAMAHARATRDDMRRSLGAAVSSPPAEAAGALGLRTLEDLAREAGASGVRLSFRAERDASLVEVADPQDVWAILTNLLLNAVAHSPRAGTVTLSLDADGRTVSFGVSDEGVGVAPERREAVFTAGESQRAGGAGIGLRHARSVARTVGGDLTLAPSERGARFVLRWPRAHALPSDSGRSPASRPGRTPQSDPPPNAPAGRPTAARLLAGRRVLLLEDDGAVVELLELSLGARGASVRTVASARALEEALGSEHFDTLLLDLSPLAGTLEPALLERARRASPGVTVIVISGTAVATPPGVAWVRKPFEPGELVDAMIDAAPRA
ncbi:MAG: sensor histidine kinase [Polyangiaceae bacterium]|nr:sensor histidine kinase [Polyangiaceae bacterium]